MISVQRYLTVSRYATGRIHYRNINTIHVMQDFTAEVLRL